MSRNIILLTVSLTFLLFLSASSIAGSDLDREHQVKAAYIYNFFSYVEWPDQAFNKEEETLSICIIGNDPFGEVFDRVEGRYAKRKRLVIRRVSSVEDIQGCHILFVSTSEIKHLASILSSLKKRSILTVSDIEGFTAKGGIIEFFKKGNNIRFKINIRALDQAGLKISSKLLELATIIK